MPLAPRALPGACFALLLWVGACQDVLGIEDAQVDPSLDSQGELVGDGGAPLSEAGALPTATTCELYCQTVTQTCTGNFAQYTTYSSCLAVCLLLPEGTPGDVSGNSVYCRMQAAGQAPLEPSFYCPAAGPGGNDVCGKNCEGLCTLVEDVCAEVVDDDDQNCQTSCAAVEDMHTYSVSPAAALHEGHHVQCRLYHASVAAEADAEKHCEHALGASPCD